MKRKALKKELLFNSNIKKLKKSDPLFYKALKGSKDVLDLDSSFDEEGNSKVKKKSSKSKALSVIEENSKEVEAPVTDKEIDEEESSEDDDDESGDGEEDENGLDEEVVDNGLHEKVVDNEQENGHDEEVEDEDSDEEVEDEDNDEEVKDDDNDEEVEDEEVEEENNDEEDSDEEEEDVDEEGDESEEEEESGKENPGSDFQITQAVLAKWEKELSETKSSVAAFKKMQSALSAALASIQGSEKRPITTPYIVKGPQIFNAVICLFLKKIPPTLHKFFELKSLSDRPVKNKKWLKLIIPIKNCLKDLILLIQSISEPTVIEALLKKGVLPLLPFYAEFSPISWNLSKQMAILWCTSHEKVRVLSVMALFRLTKSFGEDRKDKTLKLLYVSYVNNCRFTSPSTWPMIDFMRISLVELYGMDQEIAYRHGFVYIKQLALHLRNAMLVQKKERLQLICNWQYIHCLHFWSDVLGKTTPSAILQPLIYPIVQVSNGLVSLLKSPKYYPMTFHVCKILTELSYRTDTFIPVLPHLLEVLTSHRLRSKPKKNSLKPFEWNSIIKLSSSQFQESAFTDGLIEQIYDVSLYYLSTQSNSIAFPELVFPFTLQLKSFLKNTKVPSYSKKMKSLLEKINENSEFIETKRKDVAFTIADSKAIRNWQIEAEQSIPPIMGLYNQWKAVKEKLNAAEGIEDGGEEVENQFSISAIRERKRNEGDDNLTEMDEEDENEKLPVSKRKQEIEETMSKSTKKKRTENDFEGEDIIREIKLCDYEDGFAEDQ